MGHVKAFDKTEPPQYSKENVRKNCIGSVICNITEILTCQTLRAITKTYKEAISDNLIRIS